MLLGLEADRLVRCIILRGTGERVFQGGHDLAEFASITREGLEQGLVDARRLHITLGTLSVPLIASMNANTACRIGLVEEVTEIQDLDTRTDQLAESIAASPPEAVCSLRRILLRIETEPYLNAYDLERDLTLGSRKS